VEGLAVISIIDLISETVGSGVSFDWLWRIVGSPELYLSRPDPAQHHLL